MNLFGWDLILGTTDEKGWVLLVLDIVFVDEDYRISGDTNVPPANREQSTAPSLLETFWHIFDLIIVLY